MDGWMDGWMDGLGNNLAGSSQPAGRVSWEPSASQTCGAYSAVLGELQPHRVRLGVIVHRNKGAAGRAEETGGEGRRAESGGEVEANEDEDVLSLPCKASGVKVDLGAWQRSEGDVEGAGLDPAGGAVAEEDLGMGTITDVRRLTGNVHNYRRVTNDTHYSQLQKGCR